MEAEPTTAALTDQPQPETASPAPAKQEETDVFAWANNLFLYKDKLDVELFLLNKNNILYRSKYAETLNRQLHPLFIDSILEYVITGAGQGLVVRGFEAAESEENVLQVTDVANVEKLVEAMSWLGSQEKEMETFNEEDHDLKRMKAVVARCTHPDMPEPFYVIKALSQATVLKNVGAWMITGSKFEALDDGAALRIPADNQLLVIGGQLFVFNQSKLERLFGYNAKKNAIAEKKVRQIEANFQLSFADEQTLQSMVKESKSVITKLQKLDPSQVKQEDLLNHAEEMGIELMQDEAGAIIIMNAADLSKFVNLLNDDYVESNLTGLRYEIKSKKLLKPSEED
ncbi:MAG TPA: Kiwa anti-phage protein KwaB-like domain-containing protein [Candidatus Saccharimonadales bacterium]|nr:Kiwa anti-phage protein KwaB-like domain-containing protein [Candidatus Saccharimonadales bacterium]